MAFHLPILPYNHGDLAPVISRETLLFHYGRHHKAYVDKLNHLVEESPLRGSPLETIVRSSQGELFQNSAQAWNHTFYWQCLSPDTGDYEPSDDLRRALREQFGSLELFLQEFNRQAAKIFGSGWCWLVRSPEGKLGIQSAKDAETPLTGSDTPLLVVDVWEHAYYVDYRDDRRGHLDAVSRMLNWRFASRCFESSDEFTCGGLMVA